MKTGAQVTITEAELDDFIAWARMSKAFGSSKIHKRLTFAIKMAEQLKEYVLSYPTPDENL